MVATIPAPAVLAHYNMFGEESEVHCQRFKRFEIGQNPESDASKEEGKPLSEVDRIMQSKSFSIIYAESFQVIGQCRSKDTLAEFSEAGCVILRSILKRTSNSPSTILLCSINITKSRSILLRIECFTQMSSINALFMLHPITRKFH